MQGVIKAFDPASGEGLVVSDADRRVVIKAGPSADRFADVIAENSLENGGVFLEHQEGFVVMVGRKVRGNPSQSLFSHRA